MASQPTAVVGKVLTGRADEDRPLAQACHPEADVGGHSPAPDVERVGQEGHRDLVELLDDETVGKPSAEGHQMVRGDGTGDCDAHGQHSNFPALFRDAAIVPAVLFHLVLDITEY